MRRSHKLLVIHPFIYSILIFCLATPHPSHPAFLSDNDYLEELKQEVFYPCYKEMMKLNRLEGIVTAQEFHAYMKLTDKTTNLAEQTMLNQVRGKPRQAREIVYRMGLRSCLNGVKRGRVQ